MRRFFRQDLTNDVELVSPKDRGVVNDVKNLTSLNIKNENGNGAVKTTLYDLTVFNHLVMRLDTDKAWAMKEKFNKVVDIQSHSDYIERIRRIKHIAAGRFCPSKTP